MKASSILFVASVTTTLLLSTNAVAQEQKCDHLYASRLNPASQGDAGVEIKVVGQPNYRNQILKVIESNVIDSNLDVVIREETIGHQKVAIYSIQGAKNLIESFIGKTIPSGLSEKKSEDASESKTSTVSQIQSGIKSFFSGMKKVEVPSDKTQTRNGLEETSKPLLAQTNKESDQDELNWTPEEIRHYLENTTYAKRTESKADISLAQKVRAYHAGDIFVEFPLSSLDRNRKQLIELMIETAEKSGVTVTNETAPRDFTNKIFRDGIDVIKIQGPGKSVEEFVKQFTTTNSMGVNTAFEKILRHVQAQKR